jgi:hypothetical protein
MWLCHKCLWLLVLFHWNYRCMNPGVLVLVARGPSSAASQFFTAFALTVHHFQFKHSLLSFSCTSCTNVNTSKVVSLISCGEYKCFHSLFPATSPIHPFTRSVSRSGEALWQQFPNFPFQKTKESLESTSGKRERERCFASRLEGTRCLVENKRTNNVVSVVLSSKQHPALYFHSFCPLFFHTPFFILLSGLCV